MATSGQIQPLKIPDAVVALAQAAAKANGETEKYLPGWPLFSPPKMQLTKCAKCPREFCSSVALRRHSRVHRRALNIDKDFFRNRDHLAAFWDKETTALSILTALSSWMCKPGYASLPLTYARAGNELLDLVQTAASRLPISSNQLFAMLDEASENTCLCTNAADAASSVQKFLFDGEVEKVATELKSVVACTSYILERKLVDMADWLHHLGDRGSVASEISKFKDKLEKIKKYGERELTLKSIAPQAEAPTEKRREKRARTMSLVEPNIVGDTIVYDCKKLVNLVLAHKEEKAYKLGIVGTGGVGKTTLAQKIYHDPKIKATFSNQQAWICVLQEYSEVDIMREVLQNFGQSPEENETIAQLGSRLAAVIQNRSFFLVLDDVWKPEVWTNLLRTPLYDAKSGVIIVTTRNDLVAQQIGADGNHRHSVDLMSAEVGWELLQKTMNMNEEEDVQNLRKIGLEVVHRCGGLPLAINVTASVLATKDRTENEWRKVLNRGAWTYDNVPAELRGALYTSYDDLPPNLKQCFLYLSLYPEDWQIFRDDVIWLWVAEGFIEEQEGQLLEETAEEYYYELIHRNLIQPDGLYFDLRRCKMHDLLRQLACYLSREESFIGDPAKMSEPRRISVVSEKNMLVLPNTKKLHKVRTLMMRSRVPQGVDPSVFKKLLRLRVLDLKGSSIKTIPAFVEKLIHLRLLDLDETKISSLTGSIGSLINLQTLNLRKCKCLHILPSEITKLCNLRRLGLSGTPINQFPEGLCKLKFLNDIEGFPVGGGNVNAEAQDGWELKELGLLSKLRRISIIKLERAAPGSSDSFLRDKSFLKDLDLVCTAAQNDKPYLEEAVINIKMIFEQLIPPVNVEDLYIAGFFGRKYPTWLGTSYLASLKHLTLIDCGSWLQLPPLGQLRNLEYLKVEGASSVTRIGPEILGCKEAFPKLKSLLIYNMPNWEEWSFFEERENAAATTVEGHDGITEMRKGKAPARTLHLLPCLKRLLLHYCPKLRALPPQLGQQAPSLEELNIAKASCLKVVQNLYISGCEALESVSCLPEVRELGLCGCEKLMCVEELPSLQRLVLAENMEEVSMHWLPELKGQHPQLGVYDWPEEWNEDVMT